ncbi:MAG: flagellar hook-basal body complex protein FliE [Rhodobacteraceae bacterium]|nr:MAG: flagellar hook-basal body complex protein FliE [Paracoccaceae bacterium]|tara:strand:- start:975 stop:1295 length:321 start_codon:yes stop_codon:yes gene_type:complete
MSKINPANLENKVMNFHQKVLNPAKDALGSQIPETPFTDRMTNAIRQVAKAQEEAAISAKNFELGVETDLSKVMMKQQVSSLGFQLTLNVRNKVLSAYKDIMNMPV